MHALSPLEAIQRRACVTASVSIVKPIYIIIYIYIYKQEDNLMYRCHSQVYRHAKCGCNSLNTVRDMAVMVQVRHLSIRDAVGTFRDKQGCRPLVGLSAANAMDNA